MQLLSFQLQCAEHMRIVETPIKCRPKGQLLNKSSISCLRHEAIRHTTVSEGAATFSHAQPETRRLSIHGSQRKKRRVTCL